MAFDAVSGTNIRASWTVSPYDCEVTGYKIRYRPTASVGEYQVEEVVGGATSEFVIGGLRSSTRYNLAVAAVTTSGDLEYAGDANVQTLDFDGKTSRRNVPQTFYLSTKMPGPLSKAVWYHRLAITFASLLIPKP